MSPPHQGAADATGVVLPPLSTSLQCDPPTVATSPRHPQWLSNGDSKAQEYPPVAMEGIEKFDARTMVDGNPSDISAMGQSQVSFDTRPSLVDNGQLAHVHASPGPGSSELSAQSSERSDYSYAHMQDSISTAASSDVPFLPHVMERPPSKVLEASSGQSLGAGDEYPVIKSEDTITAHSPTFKPTRRLSESSDLSAAGSTSPGESQLMHADQPQRKRRRLNTKSASRFSEFKPRTTIPTGLPPEELARQSIDAALASRLNPFVLHPKEYQLLRSKICYQHVTAYISIRNRILRLWLQNPLASVTPEEAAGCATASRWLGLAEVAYEWLVRQGYINFGCVEVPDLLQPLPRTKAPSTRRKTIVVIGAGMAGLGCARQLTGLFSHFKERLGALGDEPPHVIVLEGRKRIGGRIYSHPLQEDAQSTSRQNFRPTAEMGAHIITGFDHGNPLNVLIRGQLALHYHSLKDNSSLYDIDGRIVDSRRDKQVEKLFNDILERASLYRHPNQTPTTVQGDRTMIEKGLDPSGESGPAISEAETEQRAVLNRPATLSEQGLEALPSGVDKMTGKTITVAGTRNDVSPSTSAQTLGWQVASRHAPTRDLNLDAIAQGHSHPTLGAAMDEGVRQYQQLLHLSAQDLRLMNWHFANLEYANAANLHKLSLGGWDLDIGNEFEGEHAQVRGGYIQVPHALYRLPEKLDLRLRKTICTIRSDPERQRCTITCADGEVIDADHVVLTVPLGVLKAKMIDFEPPLPSFKKDAIQRLGFGVLNKVILVYEKPFWDVDRDMIGLLRDSEPSGSDQHGDYTAHRGRFYLFWNCIKTCGRPVLIALMAGDAALQTETNTDAEIALEVNQQLQRMFKTSDLPQPSETIITRWQKDRFARGTYSYVGPNARVTDYEAMARPIGPLHFAGEATCETHPATVHGAYLSGLRAASEVIEDLIGPIELPEPLIPEPVAVKVEAAASEWTPVVLPPAAVVVPVPVEDAAAKQARLEAFEAEILSAIFAKLGPRPDKPSRSGANPFLLYSKDKWTECRERCDANRLGTLGPTAGRASRNEIRAALGQMWREAPAEVKQPYLDQTQVNRASNQAHASGFQDRLAIWDASAMEVRREYVQQHPDRLSPQEERDMWVALGAYTDGQRAAKKMSGYAD